MSVDKSIILKVCNRYITSKSNEYFSRANKIGSLFYDKFFFHLNENILRISDEELKHFNLAVENCHTPFICKTTSSKINLDVRTYRIPNLYNVIYFETYIEKLINILACIFKNDDVKSNKLISNMYFAYGHQLDFQNNGKILPYRGLWTKFEEIKKNLLKNKARVMEYDIKSYYDSINHNHFIGLLHKILKLYLTYEEYEKFGIDNFMYELSMALFKVNGFNNVGLPQSILGCDFIASLFTWLVLFNPDCLLDIKLKNGIYVINDKISMIYYVDDFYFFGDNKVLLEEEAAKIKKEFNERGLTANAEKSYENAKKTSDYKNKVKININNLKKHKVSDIKAYLDLMDIGLKNIQEEKGFLKQYFKRFYTIAGASLLVTHHFLVSIYDILTSAKEEEEKSVLTLITISETNFLALIMELINKYDHSIMNNFINLLRKYKYIITDNTLVMLYKNLKIIKNQSARSDLQYYLIESITENNNPIALGFLSEKKRLFFDNYLQLSRLKGLHNMISQSKESVKENIIGIKFNTIFQHNVDAFRSLSNKIQNLTNDQIIEKPVAYSLDLIIDNLIVIKSLFPIFYLHNESFIADIHSLFNGLLTIAYSLIYNEYVTVVLQGQRGLIMCGKSREKEKIIKVIPELREHLNLLLYIVKLRAKMNHKEQNHAILHYIGYNKNYQKIDIFENEISIVISKLSMVIEREISRKYEF